jgi:type IX secretion system PorP/SprF family membrane protein
MMKQIKIGLFIGLLASFQLTMAQQEPHYTQNIDNMLNYNPAYAGSRGMFSANTVHRSQWLGIEGTPRTTAVSAHTPVKGESIGIGIELLDDRIGPLNTNEINVDIAYSFRIGPNNGRLALGVNAGLQLINGDLSALKRQEYYDPTIDNVYSRSLLPMVGSGIYYHSDKWYIGASVPNLLQSEKSDEVFRYDNQRHYYLMTGGYFQLNRMIKVRPGVMFKYTTNAPLTVDLNTALIFYDKFYVGANYRFSESVGVFTQFQINQQFKIGYAFDFSLTDLRPQSLGSHELMLTFDLLDIKSNLYSPKFF